MAVKRFNCKECGSKYATKAKLEEHVKSHKKFPRGKKEHRCEACKEIFKTVVLLKKHRFNCSTLVSDEVPKEKRKRVGRKTSEPANKSNAKNCSNDDNLKEQMFTKVHSLLDGSKTKTVTDKFTKSGSVFAGCSLSADGIQSMSLSIKNSMDSHGQTCEKSAEIVGTGVSDTEKTAGKQKTVKGVTGRPSRKTRSRRDAGHTADSETPAISGSINVTENSVSSEPQKSLNEQEQSQVKTDFPRSKISKGLKQGLKKGNQRKSTSSERSQGEEISELGDPQDVSGSATEAENSEKSSSNSSETAGSKKTADRKQKQFTCANCAKSFSRKYHLDRHLKLYPCSGLPPPSYPCQLCNRVYTRKDNLREHLRMHTGEGTRKKKHQCTYCNKAFHGLSLLTIHIRKHTGEKPFACDFCPKQFPSAGALSKHRRTHTGEKPFVCPECGYRFSLKGTLNRHLRVHTGVRPHQCLYCGKQFIQIGGLKAHLFYHTGENGFKCDECGKIFNRKARLQMHKLYVHVKLRPYKCSSCSKSFTRKEDLNRHAILHTGKKPYKCPTCSKSFAIKPSLKLHLLTHTKEEPRSCHECGRAFIRKDCLLRHMRKRHRDLLDKILLAEKDEKFGEPSTVNSRMLSEEDLCENIQELLSLLVDESTLVSFGWPLKPVHEVLEAVIRRCGHTPVNPDQYSYMDRMRENAKLLFTVVIDDNAVKTLLNNQTVDEVILHVLRLAKT